MKKILFLCGLLASVTSFANAVCYVDSNTANALPLKSELGKTYTITAYCFSNTYATKGFKPYSKNTQISEIETTCPELLNVDESCTITATVFTNRVGFDRIFVNFDFGTRESSLFNVITFVDPS